MIIIVVVNQWNLNWLKNWMILTCYHVNEMRERIELKLMNNHTIDIRMYTLTLWSGGLIN